MLKQLSASFWVCEKSHGIRVLLLVHTDLSSNDQMIYIVRCRGPTPYSCSQRCLHRLTATIAIAPSLVYTFLTTKIPKCRCATRWSMESSSLMSIRVPDVYVFPFPDLSLSAQNLVRKFCDSWLLTVSLSMARMSCQSHWINAMESVIHVMHFPAHGCRFRGLQSGSTNLMPR
jgi:hypothetical protein